MWLNFLSMSVLSALVLGLALVPRPSAAQICAERADIAMYMVVDLSRSMAGASQQGAADFGTALIDALSATGHLNRGGAFSFSDVIIGYVPMTTNIPSLRDALNGVRSLTTGGGTLLYDAIMLGAREIYGQSSTFERLYVVLTDGNDTGSANTLAGAAAALAPGVNTELIFIGSGVSPALSSIASLAGPHVQTRAATAGNLTSLVHSVVARTCRNFRPDAGMSRTPSGDLVLGTGGFSMAFQGAPSSDVETTDSGLTFAWTLTGPRTITLSGIAPTATFTDADIGNWTVQLRVTDPRGASDATSQSFAIQGVAPDITANGPGTVNALDSVTLSATPTTDVDGGNLTFRWEVLQAPPQADLQPPGPAGWTHATESFVTNERDITEVDSSSIGTWRFRVTATDNENDTDSEEVTLNVMNLPPRIDLVVPANEIDIGATIAAHTTITDDDDGGALSFDWDIVQVPDSAGLPVQDGVQTSADFAMPTTAADAGTWIMRLRVRDNEGAEVEQDNIKILVDGPVEAAVTGTDENSLLAPFTLSGQNSVDPDTSCPTVSGGCHSTDGRAPEISDGITQWQWSLAEIPSDLDPRFTTGPVDEVLGIDGSGPVLTVPAGALRVGIWRFELRIKDAEGNEDVAFHSVEVIAPEGPPLAITAGSQIHVLQPGGMLNGTVALNGEWSFDLDNLLAGETLAPGLGITDFSWAPTIAPPGCAQAIPFGTAGAILFGPGPVVVPPECEGLFNYTLTVTDDDATPRTASSSQSIFLTSCPDVVCIESPTFGFPAEFAFSDRTDVEILYKVDPTLYALSGCILGCAAELRIFHESDLSTPVFKAVEFNPDPTLLGYSPVFKWNGFVRNPVTGAIERPRAGIYTTRIDLVDLASTPVAADTENQNIWIAVADVGITPASESLLSLNGAEAGTDRLRVDYATTGGVPVTEAKLNVWKSGVTAPVATRTQPSGPAGHFDFTGEIGASVYIDPDNYEYSVQVIGPAGVLDESPHAPFTAYRIDLEVDGTPESNEESSGVEVPDAAKPLKVVLEPAGLTGDLEIREDPATSVLGPADYPGGVTVPAASALPAFTSDVAVTEDPGSDATLVASYTPPGAPVSKEASDRVRILPLLADATAPCSDDGREATEGLFLQRRVLTGAADFGAEKFWMRRINVKASLRADEVRIVQASGTAGAVAVFVRPTPADDPVQAALPHSFATDLFDADGRLDTDVHVQGVTRDPDVRLAVEIRRGGMVLTSDEVRFRVDDLVTLAGAPVAGFPHWTGRNSVRAGEPVAVALDPAYHDDRRGLTGHVYVVPHHSPADWKMNNALADQTGGAEALAIPAAGDITASQVAVWPSAASPAAGVPTGDYDIVIDFGDCTAGAATDMTLDPEDIVVAPDANGLTVFPDLTLPGTQGARIVDYGTDFEKAPLGAVCTPVAENPAGQICPQPGPPFCYFGDVCLDTDGDGTAHCTAVNPVGTPACPANTLCVNTDNDEVAHCQGPAPRRVAIPLGYDGITGSTLEHGQTFRLRGRIVHPDPLGGTYPLVMIAHGRHTPKLLAIRPPMGSRPRWNEVPAAVTDGQNYEGLTYLQDHLARHGFISVSVDLDEAIGLGTGGTHLGYPPITTEAIRTRGWLLLKNLERALTDPAIAGHVDTSRIHFLGHSRGGEAVLQAWQILGDVPGRGPASAGLAGPDAAIAGVTQADIASVISLAPTSFETTSSPLGTTPYFLVYGSKDGDVNGFGDGIQPLLHLDKARASGPATALWVTGANHNFFSDAWPSDDGSALGAPRVGRADQKALAEAYVLAWLRLSGGATAYRTLFETSPSRLLPLSLGGPVDLHVQSRLGPATVLDDYETAPATTAASSGATVALTVNAATEAMLFDPDDADETNTPNRFKEASRGLLFDWTAPASSIALTPSGGTIDLSGQRALVLRAAQEPRHPNTVALGGSVDFNVTLEDNAGHSATINAGFDTGVSPVLDAAGGGRDYTIAFPHDVRIPLERFRVGQPALDMAHIAAIRLVFGAPLSAQGRLAIDDLEVRP